MACLNLPSASYNYLGRFHTSSLHHHVIHHFIASQRVYQPHARLHPILSCSSQPNTGDTSAWYQENPSTREELLHLFLERSHEIKSDAHSGPGAVHLVGTGPGDPGLLTLKAVNLMQTAHVVLYDRLVSEDILRLINPSALMVYVGKQQSYHTRTQREIHELLCTFASEGGATVIRLKGGDPFVFGRGGEEAEYLRDRGVNVHVVPGITAAAGISAELGIPMTHRGLATSVRFLTGHAREGGDNELKNTITAACCDPNTTLVIYMGLSTLRSMSNELLKGGLSHDMPAVAVERGTTPEQRAVWATLGTLSNDVEDAQLVSPTLIVIGNVVALAPGWQQARKYGYSLMSGNGHSSDGNNNNRLTSNDMMILTRNARAAAEEKEEDGRGWRMLS